MWLGSKLEAQDIDIDVPLFSTDQIPASENSLTWWKGITVGNGKPFVMTYTMVHKHARWGLQEPELNDYTTIAGTRTPARCEDNGEGVAV